MMLRKESGLLLFPQSTVTLAKVSRTESTATWSIPLRKLMVTTIVISMGQRNRTAEVTFVLTRPQSLNRKSDEKEKSSFTIVSGIRLWWCMVNDRCWMSTSVFSTVVVSRQWQKSIELIFTFVLQRGSAKSGPNLQSVVVMVFSM